MSSLHCKPPQILRLVPYLNSVTGARKLVHTLSSRRRVTSWSCSGKTDTNRLHLQPTQQLQAYINVALACDGLRVGLSGVTN